MDEDSYFQVILQDGRHEVGGDNGGKKPLSTAYSVKRHETRAERELQARTFMWYES